MEEMKSAQVKNSRMTRQRALILSELQKVNTHPTAEEIYVIVKRLMPKISLGTVYRNLEFLVESGEVRKLDSAGSVRHFDGDMSKHAHARCVHCDKIVDIFDPIANEVDLDAIRLENFTLLSASVEYSGVCESCMEGHKALLN